MMEKDESPVHIFNSHGEAEEEHASHAMLPFLSIVPEES